MKVVLVPSSVSEPGVQQFLTSYLINDTLAIDAGSIGFYADAPTQARVRHVFISHSHIDHLASLPVLLDNTVLMSDVPVTIHASRSVYDCLRRDIFNDRVWPDFFELTAGNVPFLRYEPIESAQSVEAEGLRITAVAVNHVVPTLGFILESATAAVIIASDTATTDEIWARANQVPNLRAIFLEATFPKGMIGLAEVSKHLTSEQFVRELQKVKPGPRLFAVHLKARFHTQVRADLQAMQVPNLEVAEPGREYQF